MYLTYLWEQRKLSTVFNIRSGRSQKGVENDNGNYPIVGTGGSIGKSKEALYSQKSVLIGRKGTIDKPVYMNRPFWAIDTVFFTEIFRDFIPKFVFYLFEQINWKRYDSSTSLPSLTTNSIYNIKVFTPSKKEQIIISKFLSKIEDIIAANELKQKSIHNTKYGYFLSFLSI